jgi:hypothetical protein
MLALLRGGQQHSDFVAADLPADALGVLDSAHERILVGALDQMPPLRLTLAGLTQRLGISFKRSSTSAPIDDIYWVDIVLGPIEQVGE